MTSIENKIHKPKLIVFFTNTDYMTKTAFYYNFFFFKFVMKWKSFVLLKHILFKKSSFRYVSIL